MTAAVDYLPDDDLIVFTCNDCRHTAHEEKGARPMQVAISAFLKREAWRAIEIDKKRRLICPNCVDRRARETLARKIADWIKRKRAEQARYEMRISA